MNYQEQLKNPLWQKKRLEIMQRDDFTCQCCGNKKSELNVHHFYYEKGLKPWEYPDWSLITLCKECHEDAHNPKPHEGPLTEADLIKNGIEQVHNKCRANDKIIYNFPYIELVQFQFSFKLAKQFLIPFFDLSRIKELEYNDFWDVHTLKQSIDNMTAYENRGFKISSKLENQICINNYRFVESISCMHKSLQNLTDSFEPSEFPFFFSETYLELEQKYIIPIVDRFSHWHKLYNKFVSMSYDKPMPSEKEIDNYIHHF